MLLVQDTRSVDICAHRFFPFQSLRSCRVQWDGYPFLFFLFSTRPTDQFFFFSLPSGMSKRDEFKKKKRETKDVCPFTFSHGNKW